MSRCEHVWCTCPHSQHTEHSTPIVYTPSSMNSVLRSGITVGVGVNFIEAEGEPSVVVHLDGGLSNRPEIDEDAYLTVAEARQLLAQLTHSIAVAEGVTR